MAVEVPPLNVWKGQAVIVHNMQEVAGNSEVWSRYMGLNPIQRENFKVALSMDFVVKFETVLMVSKPVVTVTTPPVPVPMPERIVSFQSSASDFKGWLTRQAGLVNGSGALKFILCAKDDLSDGTVTVPIYIERSGSKVGGTGFVFHYHPGASGPSVGHGYASEGHFKPFDGAPKHVRVEKHECVGTLSGLFSTAKGKAKSK
jgi:hypothetical protein